MHRIQGKLMNAPMILYYLFKLMFLFFKIFSSASFSRLLDKLKLISVYTIYKIQSEILYLIHCADFLSIKCLQEFVMCLFSLEMNVQIDKRTLTPKKTTLIQSLEIYAKFTRKRVFTYNKTFSH